MTRLTGVAEHLRGPITIHYYFKSLDELKHFLIEIVAKLDNSPSHYTETIQEQLGKMGGAIAIAMAEMNEAYKQTITDYIETALLPSYRSMALRIRVLDPLRVSTPEFDSGLAALRQLVFGKLGTKDIAGWIATIKSLICRVLAYQKTAVSHTQYLHTHCAS